MINRCPDCHAAAIKIKEKVERIPDSPLKYITRTYQCKSCSKIFDEVVVYPKPDVKKTERRCCKK